MKDPHIHLKPLIQIKPTSCCSILFFIFLPVSSHKRRKEIFFFSFFFSKIRVSIDSSNFMAWIVALRKCQHSRNVGRALCLSIPRRQSKDLCLAAPTLHARLPSASMKMNSSCQQLSPELPREQ